MWDNQETIIIKKSFWIQKQSFTFLHELNHYIYFVTIKTNLKAKNFRLNLLSKILDNFIIKLSSKK